MPALDAIAVKSQHPDKRNRPGETIHPIDEIECMDQPNGREDCEGGGERKEGEERIKPNDANMLHIYSCDQDNDHARNSGHPKPHPGRLGKANVL